MSELFADQPFPRGAVHAGAALVVMTIAFAGLGHYTGVGASHVPASPVTESLSVRFLDNDGGGVRVETIDGHVIRTFVAGQGGFLRGVLRGFARDRRSREEGSELPFELTRHADGRLSLTDDATGRVVELSAFGPDNVGVFASLMTAGKDAR